MPCRVVSDIMALFTSLPSDRRPQVVVGLGIDQWRATLTVKFLVVVVVIVVQDRLSLNNCGHESVGWLVIRWFNVSLLVPRLTVDARWRGELLLPVDFTNWGIFFDSEMKMALSTGRHHHMFHSKHHVLTFHSTDWHFEGLSLFFQFLGWFRIEPIIVL